MKVFSHNALKYSAVAMTIFVSELSGDENISLIFPSVFSFTQLKERNDKRTVEKRFGSAKRVIVFHYRLMN